MFRRGDEEMTRRDEETSDIRPQTRRYDRNERKRSLAQLGEGGKDWFGPFALPESK